MGQSKLNICNQALLKIGEQTITSLDEASESARLCNLFYDQALEEVLREYTWNCSLSRAQLSLLPSTPAFGYDYEYQLPLDCLRVVQMYDSTGSYNPKYRWTIEGRKLLCNIDEVYIKYVKRIEDSLDLDSLCVNAVVCKLAMKMAFSRTDSRSFVTSLIEEYEQVILPRARSINTFENRDYQEDEIDPWLLDRTGSLYSGNYTE